MEFINNVDKFKELNGYDIDGVWFPRVTKIIGIKSKPALYFYYAEAKDYKTAQASTQKSAEEGTLIHEVVQDIMIGKKPEIPEKIAPSVNAAIEFLDKNNIQIDPEFIEKRIVNHDKRYAGTIDAVALIDGKLGVMDIKTSQAIYRDYNLQTAAYMEPLIKDIKGLQTRWILRIDQIQICQECNATLRIKGDRKKIRAAYPSNGMPKCGDEYHIWSEVQGIIELKEFPFWQKDYEAFLSAKHLWEWENYKWLKLAGYLE